MYDAIDFSVRTLEGNLNSDCSGAKETILILLADGEDRASQLKLKSLLQLLKDSKTRIFAIGLIEELDAGQTFVGSSDRKKSQKVLEEITKATKGKVVFAKKEQGTGEIVDELFRMIKNRN